MERLTEAERVLKYGVIPDDEGSLLAFRKQHEVSITCYIITPYREIHFFSSYLLQFRSNVRVRVTKQHPGADKDSVSASRAVRLGGYLLTFMLEPF